jgi:hypothetical protein
MWDAEKVQRARNEPVGVGVTVVPAAFNLLPFRLPARVSRSGPDSGPFLLRFLHPSTSTGLAQHLLIEPHAFKVVFLLLLVVTEAED